MDAATISAIAEVIDALPDGPYVVVETPFPALEQIAGRDINLGSTFGDINLPFGEDALDVHTEETDDNSTKISVAGVDADLPGGNGEISTDSAIEPTPEPETGEIATDSAVDPTPEPETGEIATDSAVEPTPELPTLDPSEVEPEDTNTADEDTNTAG